jgi:hypothetical protein
MSSEEGASRLAVKRLTNDIQQALVSSTINAPDWLAASASNVFFLY